MSKAVLVFEEMPKNCAECFLFDYEEGLCCVDKLVPVYHTRPQGCPLKEMPQEKEIDEDHMEDLRLAYNSGWNDCLEEMEGHDNA